jgi:hypothetical protein
MAASAAEVSAQPKVIVGGRGHGFHQAGVSVGPMVATRAQRATSFGAAHGWVLAGDSATGAIMEGKGTAVTLRANSVFGVGPVPG